jgi:hypothetical protein
MDSMESPRDKLTASMADALVDSWLIRKYLREPTTTPSPVTPSTQNTTPSYRQAWERVWEQLFTSQTNPVGSASISSNAQRSEESLYWVEYQTLEDYEVTQARPQDEEKWTKHWFETTNIEEAREIRDLVAKAYVNVQIMKTVLSSEKVE